MTKKTFERQNKYGFWKQKNPQEFMYNLEYKQSQSTNTDMSWLRIGWLTSFFSYEKLKNMTVVDIGSGNGTFVNIGKQVFLKCVGFDVSGETISKEDLYDTEWDIVVLSDVLEHFKNIDDLFKIKWRYAFISYPETPPVKCFKDLAKWRHFKPDEHIWCLNKDGMKRWLEENNCEVLKFGDFEDIIRTRWNNSFPNITSVLVKYI